MIESEYRTEHDSLGERDIPGNVYYGIQSDRARENFAVSGKSLDDYVEFINAIAIIKIASAKANFRCGGISEEMCDVICLAANEIIDGKMKGNFPIDVIQGGGDTSANMNVNEVIANRANELLCGHKGYERVHPNTHVNMGQSTNDVIPAAMKLACYSYLDKLISSAGYFQSALNEKALEFVDVVKMGRTCLQDALPITLGQEFSGYTDLIKRRVRKLKDLQEECFTLALGGTAVGTSLSIRKGYLENVYEELSSLFDREVKADPNFFDALQNADDYMDISNAVKVLACGASKIATDLRFLSSGPSAGLMEITLPAVQPGSSIMPGKVNPVMPELINQICYQVCGNDLTVTMACEGGELDLNVWEPVIIKSLAEATTMLSRGLELFTDKCIKGIKANRMHCRAGIDRSVTLATVIASLKDYPTGSRIAKMAMHEGITIKEAVVKEGILSEAEAEELLDPLLLSDGVEFANKIEEYRK